MIQITDLPQVDYAPVRHGRWIDANNRPKSQMIKCSECQGIAYYPQVNRWSGSQRRYGYKYCPNCGAKMDLANDEQMTGK